MNVQYILIAIGVTAVVAFLQSLLLHALPLLFPLSEPRARRHAEKMNELAAAEYLLSFAAMVLLPVGGYQLLVRSVRSAPDDLVLFWGEGLFVFLNVLAGIFMGPFLTRWYIRARFRHVDGVLEAYAHSEDQHGAAGRALMRYAGRIALALIIASAVLSANKYTLVTRHGIELAKDRGRELRPYSDVAKVTPKTVVLRDGRTLSTDDQLSGFGKTPKRAIQLISERSRRPVSDR